MRTLIISTIATFLLAGCGGGATVSQNQCAAGDWQTLGYRDGVNGRRSTQLLAHQDACVEHGVIPDRAGYMLGWEQGIGEYCEPNNAFSIGEAGYGHNNVCPQGQRTEFLSAYQDGRSLYLARVEVDNLHREIHNKTARLEQVKASLVSSATAQLTPTLTAADRIELLAKTQRLNDERSRILAELPRLERELDRKTAEMNQLNDALASVTY